MSAAVFLISGLYAISLASFGSIAGVQSSGVEQGSADRGRTSRSCVTLWTVGVCSLAGQDLIPVAVGFCL